jgi:hypothetical protein
MRTAFVGVVLVAAAGAALAQPGGYSSDEGKYRVKFPDRPKVTEPVVKTDVGELKVSVATYAGSDGNTYMVSFTDFPDAATRKENHKTLLDGIREGLIKGSGKVTGEKEREFGPDKHPGREIVVEKGKQRIKLQVIIRDSRVYQVAVIGTPEFVGGKEATKFLESFELSK